MLIAFKDKSLIKKLKSHPSNEFEMKEVGATKKILGMKIQRDQRPVSFTYLKGNTLRKLLLDSTWAVAKLCLLLLLQTSNCLLGLVHDLRRILRKCLIYLILMLLVLSYMI